jgi:hypothetical protein
MFLHPEYSQHSLALTEVPDKTHHQLRYVPRRTQRFGLWICFLPHVKRRGIMYLGLLNTPNLSHCFKIYFPRAFAGRHFI